MILILIFIRRTESIEFCTNFYMFLPLLLFAIISRIASFFLSFLPCSYFISPLAVVVSISVYKNRSDIHRSQCSQVGPESVMGDGQSVLPIVIRLPWMHSRQHRTRFQYWRSQYEYMKYNVRRRGCRLVKQKIRQADRQSPTGTRIWPLDITQRIIALNTFRFTPLPFYLSSSQANNTPTPLPPTTGYQHHHHKSPDSSHSVSRRTQSSDALPRVYF